MTWEIRITPAAERDIRRLDRDVASRVASALHRLAETNRGDVRQLHGRGGEHRLRLGGWRLIYEQDREAHAIVVLHVLPRGRAYRR